MPFGAYPELYDRILSDEDIKVELSWIKDYVPELDCTVQEYVDAMTLSGTKVEGYEQLDKNLEKIVVGKILSIEKHPDADFYCFTSKAKQSYTDIRYPENVYLIFGKETPGLPTEFTAQHPERCVRLPMRPGQRCLNLSNAVAVGVYEVLRQHGFPEQV